MCFFFFSSRRRHTRSKRDWSSDVCSSDLDFLDGHDAQRKVGIITSADIATPGAKPHIEVAGYLYGRDFPEVVQRLRAGGRRLLGMSYEVAEARVRDVRASVWELTDVIFTGAAVLLRDKAAYRNTWIEVDPFTT